MSLRARLVVALLALFAIGMAVYGVVTYQTFAGSEFARLDEDVRGALPIVERQFSGDVGYGGSGFGGSYGGGWDGSYGGGWGGPPRIVIPPGTYAELRAADDTVLESVQIADYPDRPDLSAIDVHDDAMWTVPSLEGNGSWRVAADRTDDGQTVVAAMPMSSVEQALGRLLVIELAAGSALLVMLGVGAWFVLRSGLRPLERIAAATESIDAGSLDQRVPVPDADTETRQLAIALNTMLDDLEDAFHEREATEARLRRFLSDASHELRTPLTSIQGYAELFRLGADSDDVDLTLVMRRIEDESGRMRGLVDNLLALARLDESHPLVREPVDLAVLAADACSDAAAADTTRRIELDAPAPVTIVGDPGHLRQAISNLVTNARCHTPAGSPIAVVVAERDHQAIVEVRDHGDGLDPEALPHVFDRFWQADPSRVGAGTGLGLSIVRAVAIEHGGTATADNASDGGAVFTLALPTVRDGQRSSTDSLDEGSAHA